jgi:hypothetical protein
VNGHVLPLVWGRVGGNVVGLNIVFEDGRHASLPHFEGMFLYPVPRSRWSKGHRPAYVIARDRHGHVLDKRGVFWRPPEFSPQAEVAKARKIISFRATAGFPVYLWVMPDRRGGICFVSNQTGGCRPPGFTGQWPPFWSYLQGGAHSVLFFGYFPSAVATIVLRYQNGTREWLRPIDGFVLHEITPAHYTRGTRLVAYVALNRNGKTISTIRLHPQQQGQYPCKKPVNEGHGAHICP